MTGAGDLIYKSRSVTNRIHLPAQSAARRKSAPVAMCMCRKTRRGGEVRTD
ncbi:MAG: hypothetical protein AMXMBFR36_18810 [Acidobacteriota bacterium]